MPQNFKIGQALMRDEEAGYQYGAIVNMFDGLLEIAPVFALRKGILCYDDPHANKQEHRHNVRLRDCPPPFSFLCASVESGKCFADGNLDKRYTVSAMEAEAQMVLVEEESLMTDRDVAEILYHPWPQQKEQEKTFVQDMRKKPGRRLPDFPAAPSVDNKADYDGPDF